MYSIVNLYDKLWCDNK